MRRKRPSPLAAGGGGWRYRVTSVTVAGVGPGGKTALPLPLAPAPRPTPLFNVVRIETGTAPEGRLRGPGYPTARRGLDAQLQARGDGSDQAGRTGGAQGIAVPTFKPDQGEMRRV